MTKTIDSNTRFFIDIDLKNRSVLGWDCGQRFGLEKKLPDLHQVRIFITRGQFNKLLKDA